MWIAHVQIQGKLVATNHHFAPNMANFGVDTYFELERVFAVDKSHFYHYLVV